MALITPNTVYASSEGGEEDLAIKEIIFHHLGDG